MVSSIKKEKAERFLKFHQDKEILVLLNSWDIGSSKLIEACGYKAIATTSMGIAASLGYPDCQVIQLSEMIEAIAGIVNAVQVPVTVDIEAGYGNSLNEIIDSVKKIIATGIVGVNIEDSIYLNPILIDEMEFCERISAIRALSDSLGFHLVINARTDSFYTSSGSTREKLSESIKRGNKYREAGADCIFIQPVWEKETISTLVKEINAPTLLKIRAQIEKMAADRVIASFIDQIGTKEAKMLDKLMEDHPEISEIDALLLMSDDMPGLKLEIEKNINSLYKELTYK
jgi:2-methylisocitrate lyase-like PEP mutase family enzyme